MSRSAHTRTVVVAGFGMVGHRFVSELTAKGGLDRWRVVVIGEEERPAYDRVHLSDLFHGSTTDGLALAELDERVEIRCGQRVTDLCAASRTVVTSTGDLVPYDALVIATGSVPFVPDIPGRDGRGCFTYRTVDDVHAIREWARDGRTGVVIGGGLLGLEAANALLSLGLDTSVVELAPRLMALQVDDPGGAVLRDRIEELGVRVHTSTPTTEMVLRGGRVRAVRFADGSCIPADLVVFSAGIRPRDELARQAGLAIGERGGIVIDDTCRSSDQHIWAIGECAVHRGRIHGLVAPGYEMARVVADQLCGGNATFEGAEPATKLKLLGVDVASFGDPHGEPAIVLTDRVRQIHKRVVIRAGKVAGGVLIGDTSSYPTLLEMSRTGQPVPDNLIELLTDGASSRGGLICSCNNVDTRAVREAVQRGAHDLSAVTESTGAGTGCGGCLPALGELIASVLTETGITVERRLCEHFRYTRQELFDIVRVQQISSFTELLARYGSGRGCEICKPTVASILASLNHGYILDGEQASLQDTNDHFLANLQKNGTYSVVPRVPGGEITPDQLIAIGEVAREFDLYTKITGGQRIDLFGARIDQLPLIWRRLIDAGLESGHAYGKAVRTVKSCVGSTWCRYGVQDSVDMAVQLELRYRGLRAPHKVKMAVSGCVRECAEAQSKDVGVIATEQGWNLFVCGNGGARPQHAVLLAENLSSDELVRLIDRFLIFYIRTADRLERTATWFRKLDGGIDHLRRVLIDDSLGLCGELERAMEEHVSSYECEWKATLASEERLRRFRTFVNSDQPDPSIVFVRERGQIRPAPATEGALR
jgi:nitrite reductase (NADH) large subunit